jgi:glycosyltransferase involved in cell wall biosynthesis
MKLLIVVKNYYPSVGGTQIFFQHLAEYCVQHFGFEVQVYTTDSLFGPEKNYYKKIDPSEEYINGVLVKRFKYRRWHRKPFLIAQKAFIKLFSKSSNYLAIRRTGPWSASLQKAIENSDADIIVGATSAYKYMTYPLIRHKLRNPKPFIYQGAFHFDINKQQQHIANYVLNSIKQSEFYLANSDYEKEALVDKGIPPGIIEVLGVAVEQDISKLKFDAEYRKQLKLSTDQPLIAYIGRITKFKSLDILLKCMHLVCKKIPSAHLLIAGYDNDYADELKQLMASFPIEISSNILFRLNIDDIEKYSIYNSIDLLVLPSKSESFGMVFLEAWTFKKAVIGAKIGAIDSIITDGVDGVLFIPDDLEHLAACIIGILQDNEKKSQLGIEGYNKLVHKYSRKVIGEKFKCICEEAIEKFKASKSD